MRVEIRVQDSALDVASEIPPAYAGDPAIGGAVAFVGLANLMGVSPGIAGGAAISGAILGDKIAKISDTVTLTTAVVGSANESLDLRRRSLRKRRSVLGL